MFSVGQCNLSGPLTNWTEYVTSLLRGCATCSVVEHHFIPPATAARPLLYLIASYLLYVNLWFNFSPSLLVLSLNVELVFSVCEKFPWRQYYCVRWQPQKLFFSSERPPHVDMTSSAAVITFTSIYCKMETRQRVAQLRKCSIILAKLYISNYLIFNTV